MSFTDTKFAQNYEQKLSEEGYPGALLDPVMCELDTCEEVIDVGAGTGFFALPLAHAGKKVRAVEPSAEMISIFKSKIPAGLAPLISIEQKAWGHWDGPHSQSLICIHSVYVIPNLEDALLKMKEKASRVLVIVRAAHGRRVLSQEIRNHLNLKREHLDFYQRLSEILNKNNINYTVRDIIEDKETLITDLDSEADYYSYFLKMPDRKTEIRTIIKEVTLKKNNGYMFKIRHHDHLFVF